MFRLVGYIEDLDVTLDEGAESLLALADQCMLHLDPRVCRAPNSLQWIVDSRVADRLNDEYRQWCTQYGLPHTPLDTLRGIPVMRLH